MKLGPAIQASQKLTAAPVLVRVVPAVVVAVTHQTLRDAAVVIAVPVTLKFLSDRVRFNNTHKLTAAPILVRVVPAVVVAVTHQTLGDAAVVVAMPVTLLAPIFIWWTMVDEIMNNFIYLPKIAL